VHAIASILGPVRVNANGEEVHLGGKLTRRFLARLLLAEGAPLTASELIDAIWSEPTSNETLRVQVNRLRALIEVAGVKILTTRTGWALDPTTYQDARTELRDLKSFVHAIREPSAAIDLCSKGLALWSGPSLADVSDAMWAMGEAARLNRIRDTFRQLRAEALACSGAVSDALAEFTMISRELPLDERSAAWVAACLGQLGHTAESLTVLAALRDRLREDLGQSPGDMVETVERLVLNNASDIIGEVPLLVAFDRRKIARSTTALNPTTARPSGLVGRDDAWAQLVDERARPAFRAVVVAGDQGAGKTRLVEEFLRLRVQTGAIVLRGAFHENFEVPHEALAEALAGSSDLRVEGAIESSPTLRSLGSDLGPSGDLSETRPEPIGIAFGQLLQRLGTDAPTVVVIEDAHWAPTSSLTALGRAVHFSYADANHPVEMIITSRNEGIHHPTFDELLRVVDTPRTSIVELASLGADEVGQLLVAAGRSADPVIVEAISELTDGNAFLVSEVVANFTDEALRLILHRPVAGQRARTGLPVPIDAALARRVSQLSERARSLVTTVACYRAPVPISVLTRILSELTDDEVYAAIDEALLARFVAEDPATGALRLVHVLYEFAIVGSVPRRSRQRLHRQIADVLLRDFEKGTATTAAVVAEQLQGAGPLARPEELATWLIRTADHARAQGAFETALHAADRAIELLETSQVGGDALLKALRLRQLVAANSGDARSSKATGQRIVRMAIEAGDYDTASQAVVLHCSYGRDQREDPESLALADVVIERSSSQQIPRIRALAAKGFHCSMWLGDSVQGRQLALGAAALARESGDRIALGEALFALGISQLGLPSLDELDAVVAELRRNGLVSGRTTDTVRSWRLSGLAAIQRGDAVALQWAITELEGLGHEPGQWHVLSDIARWRSSLAHCEGRFDAAELLRIEQRERGFGISSFEGSALAQQALQLLAVGQLPIDHPMFPMIRSNRSAWIASAAIFESLRVECRSARDITDRLGELIEALGPLERNRNRLCDLVALVVFAEAAADCGNDVRASAETLRTWLTPYGTAMAFSSFGEHIFGAMDRFLAITNSLLGDHEAAQKLFAQAQRQEERLSFARCAAETVTAKVRALRRQGIDDEVVHEAMVAAWSDLGVARPTGPTVSDALTG
jgi:DNA-binding SARP family transcriptional activator